MSHEHQHQDPPTWCIHCGMFDTYTVSDPECRAAVRDGRYDSREAENFSRMFADVFGVQL
jgi:hypothetical protein